MRKGLVCLIPLVATSLLFSSCADLKRAKLYYLTGKPEKAREELEPLVKRNFPEAYYLMGRLIAEEKLPGFKREDAVYYYKKAYELGYRKAAKSLGFLYRSLGDYEKALVWLRRASEGGDLQSRIAFLKLKLFFGRIEEREIEELLKLSESSPKVLNDVGSYYLKLGKIDLAEKYLKKAYSQGVVGTGLRLAKIYLRTGREEEAEKLLREVYRKTGEKEAALLIGKVYERRARRLKLDFCPVERASSAKDYFLLRLGVKRDRELLYRRAQEWYERALPDPEAEYRYKRVEWALKGERCENVDTMRIFAEKGVKAALSDLKRCEEPQKRSDAKEFLEKGDLERACILGSSSAEINLALEKERENPELAGAVFYYYAKEKEIPKAMLALSELYFKYGEEEKGVEWLKKAADKGYVPAARKLAYYLLERGNEKEAVKYLLFLEEKGYCSASLKLGAVYEGDYGDEVIDFEKALHHYKVAISGNCTEAYYRTAKLLFTIGRPEEAFGFAKRYLLLSNNEEDRVKALVLLAKVELLSGKLKESAKYMEMAIEGGYVPGYRELKVLLPYLKRELLLKDGVRGRVYLLLSKEFVQTDFKLGLCLAYKATLDGAPQAASFLFRLGVKVDSEEKALFLKEVNSNPKACDEIIEKEKSVILQKISSYGSHVK
jgi:TPR repeat protein